MPRIPNHETETKSRQIFEAAVTNFGDMLFRSVSERDYGVDGIVEFFSDGEPTGRIAHIQLKGTQGEIRKLVGSDEVSCSGISKSNLSYCRQNNIPVMLVYVSTADGKFYYIDLQSIYQGKIEQIADKQSGTVRIPMENNSDDLGRFVAIINSYYDRENKGGPMAVRKEKETRCSDPDELKTSYEISLYDRPADGEHKQIGENDEVLSVGYWKDEKLEYGTEFNFLIQVKKGRLIFKPDCPEDPYDSSPDFEYDKLEQYGWYAFDVFQMARNYIIEDGLGSYYVVDFDVTKTTEQMKNIRTLKEFLKEREPEWLEEIEKEIQS